MTAVGALADPTRRSLYDYIAQRHEPVTREEVARAVSISLSKAKFHLDRLEREGLLDVEFRRVSGRTGPGAGRPAKLYRRSGRAVSVSFPERRYDIAGDILAAAVGQAQRGEDLTSAVNASAYARGVADAASTGGSATDAALEPGKPTAPVDAEGAAVAATLSGAQCALSRLGYEPELRGEELVLHNCPFDALAEEHREVVCAMNQHYVQGVLDASGAGSLESRLDPVPGKCCVIAGARTTPARCADDCCGAAA